jgi:hypothetical protein
VNLAASITDGLTDFKSAVTINEFLSPRLQAEDAIAPRRAASMAYTANLMLRTLSAIEHEPEPKGEDAWPSLGDLPGPRDTWPVDATSSDTSWNAPGSDISTSYRPSPL